jgi:hypothetical protein
MEWVFRNTSTGTVDIVVEPWAEQFDVKVDEYLSLRIFSQKDGNPEFEIGSGIVSIWLWSGCRAEVSVNGSDKTPKSLSLPVP